MWVLLCVSNWFWIFFHFTQTMFCLLVIGVVFLCVQGHPWPMQRYDPQRTSATSSSLSLSSSKLSLFNVSCGSNVHASVNQPIPASDSILLMTCTFVYDGFSATAVTAVAINGGPLWLRQPSGPNENTNFVTDPVVSRDGLVFVACDDNQMYALSLTTGRTVWNFTTDDIVYSAAVLGPDNTVCFGSQTLYCVDSRTGVLKWNLSTIFLGEGQAAFEMTITDKFIFCFAPGEIAIVSVDGKLIWNFVSSTSQDGLLSAAVTSNGKFVYVVGVDNSTEQVSSLYVIDVIRQTFTQNRNVPQGGVGSFLSPLNHSVLVSGANSISAFRLDGASIIWTASFNSSSVQDVSISASGRIVVAPLVHSNFSISLAVLDAQTGKLVESIQLPGVPAPAASLMWVSLSAVTLKDAVGGGVIAFVGVSYMPNNSTFSSGFVVTAQISSF
jgi:outer membrane protein assembly factor BamB